LLATARTAAARGPANDESPAPVARRVGPKARSRCDSTLGRGAAARGRPCEAWLRHDKAARKKLAAALRRPRSLALIPSGSRPRGGGALSSSDLFRGSNLPRAPWLKPSRSTANNWSGEAPEPWILGTSPRMISYGLCQYRVRQLQCSRLPEVMWRFACEQTLDKKLSVARAAPAPFERSPLNLTCKS
jgi:hypothetical protein